MAIFLDSGNLKEIETFMKMGILRGVTTNPTILLKDGVSGGKEGIRRRAVEIARLIHPFPLSLEVTTNDRVGMVDEAREFAGYAENMVVKVTVHGPQGELDNMEVIHTLASKHRVKVNVTAMMSAQQCLLAAMAGATYVSLFVGRVNNMGYDGAEEVRRTRDLLDRFSLDAEIIAASTREILNVTQWLLAGAHIVTVLPDILKGMIVHPYTKETVQQFLRDAARVG